MPSSQLSGVELRALRVLRRVGSLGVLQRYLFPRLRPAKTAAMREALQRLERDRLIERSREPRHAERQQTLWRITASGRALIDSQPQLPPAA